MTSPALDFADRRAVGKYQLLAELARGGMGNVSLAAANGPGGFQKLVVLKELKPEFCHDETYVSMFMDEARLAARLTHTNIVQTFEVGSDGDRHFMVMEFLDGRSLHRLSRPPQGILPVGAHLRILAEALLGLHYAHELRGFDGEPLGIVHRDIGPLNIFVTFEGQTKILDFGIAKTVDSSMETRAGVLKGRVAYMAPEQARGARVDRRADIYSAGVMIWEAAANTRLWSGKTEVEILMHVVSDRPPSLRTVAPDAPADLEAICSRAMAPNPADRYSTASELLKDLDAHLARRSDAMSTREIGALMNRAFRAERAKTSEIVEQGLMRMATGSRSGVMPVFQGRFVDARNDSGDLPVDMGSLSSLPTAQRSVSRPWEGTRSFVDALAPNTPLKRWRIATVMAIAAAFVSIAVHRVQQSGSTAKLESPPPAAALPATRLEAMVAPPSATHSPAPSSTQAPVLPDDVHLARPGPPPSDWREPAWREPPARRPAFGKATPVDSVHRVAPTDTPASVTSLAPTHGDVDPAGGHAPLRPIVTSNPYGVP
jgi:eukaryotic-like serine/threonine-protein kinase